MTTGTTAEAVAIAHGLTKAQREYLTACPLDAHICAQVGHRNWGCVPAALGRKGLLFSQRVRAWDSNASVTYSLTPLGLAVREAIIREQGSA